MVSRPCVPSKYYISYTCSKADTGSEKSVYPVLSCSLSSSRKSSTFAISTFRHDFFLFLFKCFLLVFFPRTFSIFLVQASKQPGEKKVIDINIVQKNPGHFALFPHCRQVALYYALKLVPCCHALISNVI